jgi:rhamnosyltransferase
MNIFNVSVVIPVLNGIKTLEKLLNKIKEQKRIGNVEVIVIDSGSSDGTLELLSDWDVKLIKISGSSFNHGTTRNIGVASATYSLLQLTVQDALPVDNFWLYNMSKHFYHTDCAAVVGAQVVLPGDSVNPHSVFRPIDLPTIKTVQFKNSDDFINLSPEEKRGFCGVDNVNTMYRKDVLLNLPFEHILFGEDMQWAKNALELGEKIIYDSSVQVSHYHFEFPDFIYRRVLFELGFKYKIFGIKEFHELKFREYLLVIYRNIKNGYAIKWIFYSLQIIYITNKAIKKINVHLNDDTVDVFINELSVEIPIGNVRIG